MIYGIIGNRGGGKTLFGLTRAVVKTLVTTDRWVVTNLTEIKVPELQEYLAEKYPKEAVNLFHRLQIIPKDKTREYYRYRGSYTMPEFKMMPKGVELPEALDARLAEYFLQCEKRSEIGKPDKGVVYVLDEMHRHAKAKEWADIAPVVEFHLNQLRHLNDNFWWITPEPESVFTFLRRATQECYHIRNQYIESFGLFKKPGCFWWRMFYHVPEAKDRNSKPSDQGKIYMDVKGLASCYNTRGALGGTSAVPETRPSRFKLPFWMAWAAAAVAIVAVLGLLWFGPKVITGYIGHLMGQGQKAGESLMGVKAAPASSSLERPLPRGTVSVDRTSGEHSGDRNQVEPEKPVRLVEPIRGYAYTARGVNVILADGTVVTEADGRLGEINPRRKGVMLDGVWHPMAGLTTDRSRVPAAPARFGPAESSPEVPEVPPVLPSADGSVGGTGEANGGPPARPPVRVPPERAKALQKARQGPQTPVWTLNPGVSRRR